MFATSSSGQILGSATTPSAAVTTASRKITSASPQTVNAALRDRQSQTSLGKVLQWLQTRQDVVAAGSPVCWPLIIQIAVIMAEGATKEGLCAQSQIGYGSGTVPPFILRTWDEDDTLINSSTYTNLELENGPENLSVRAEARRCLAESPFKEQSPARAQSDLCQHSPPALLPPFLDASVSAAPVIPIIPNRLASATEENPRPGRLLPLSLPEAPVIGNTWQEATGRITGLLCGPQAVARRCYVKAMRWLTRNRSLLFSLLQPPLPKRGRRTVVSQSQQSLPSTADSVASCLT